MCFVSSFHSCMTSTIINCQYHVRLSSLQRYNILLFLALSPFKHFQSHYLTCLPCTRASISCFKDPRGMTDCTAVQFNPSLRPLGGSWDLITRRVLLLKLARNGSHLLPQMIYILFVLLCCHSRFQAYQSPRKKLNEYTI